MPAANGRRFLLFRAGSFERLAVPLSLVARLEEISLSPRSSMPAASAWCNTAAGSCRWLPWRRFWTPARPTPPASQDPAQVVVFNDGERSIGILVDQILDIVEETVTVRQTADAQGIAGLGGDRQESDRSSRSARRDSGGRRRAGSSGRDAQRANGATVMIAEPSAFVRGLVRNSLEMAGYHVVETADTQAALRELERARSTWCWPALDLPSDGGSHSSGRDAARARLGTAFPRWPWSISAEQVQSAAETAREGSPDYQMKFDRDAMLQSLARLAAALARAETAPVLAGEKRLKP